MTPEELTVLLYQSGSLRQGRVAEVQEAKNEAFNSHIHHLQVSYSPDVVPLLPSALLSIAAEDPVLPVLRMNAASFFYAMLTRCINCTIIEL